jgi:hypothetical protein
MEQALVDIRRVERGQEVIQGSAQGINIRTGIGVVFAAGKLL